MKYILTQFFLFICISLFSQSPDFRSYTQKYDLDLKRFEWGNTWGWMKRYSNASCDRMKDESVRISYKPIMRDVTNLMFVLSKIVSVPPYKGKETCCIILKSKSENLNDVVFSITSLDEDENEIFQDSIILKNGSWKKDSISFKLTKEKVIKINVHYLNGDSNPKQEFSFSNVNIKIDGKDIGANNVYEIDELTRSRLNMAIDKKLVIPLSSEDISLFPVIDLIKDKKLIGLAECTHGSLAIKNSVYHFSRILIERGDVRLFIVERPMDMLLKYDLFVQGQTSKEFIKELKEDARCFKDDYEAFLAFLSWLRNYNETAQEKVHIVGVDGLPVPQLSLYQYHITLLGKKASLPYLRLIMNNKYSDLIELAKTDPKFLKKIDKKQFEFYKFVVESCINMPDEASRDFDMAQRTQKATNIFVRRGEKAIIHMHSTHLGCIPLVDNAIYHLKTTGYFLKDWYDSGFFTISFQIGEGEYTDEPNVFGKQLVTPLLTPMPQSFESVAANIGLNYFFYPSSDLGKDIIFCNRITRGGLTIEKDIFASARKSFDGYIYIRQSTPLRDVESFPALYMPDYVYENKIKIEKMIIEN